jgi:anti-anti-sigma factor
MQGGIDQTEKSTAFTKAHFHDVIEPAANGVTVIRLAGHLAGRECAMALREEARDLAARGVKKLAVDLGKLSEIDSSGVGALAAIYNCFRDAHGKVRYFSAGDRVTRTLQKTHLDRVFDLLPDERSALSGY